MKAKILLTPLSCLFQTHDLDDLHAFWCSLSTVRACWSRRRRLEDIRDIIIRELSVITTLQPVQQSVWMWQVTARGCIPIECAFARIGFKAVNDLLKGSKEIPCGELAERLVMEDLVEGILCPLFVFFGHRRVPLKRAMRYKTRHQRKMLRTL